MKPPVSVGELVHLKEPDYCYGLGDLVLRVTGVPDRLTEPEWVDIRGFEVLWNGERGKERQVRARINVLRNPHSRETP